MATTQFDNVYHGSGKLLGMIRFSDAGLGWKPLDEGATVTIPELAVTTTCNTEVTIPDVQPWTAETPRLYLSLIHI